MAMLGAESSQAERRNVANANLNSKRMPVMLDLFWWVMTSTGCELSPPNITGILFFEFNLHHLDEPDGKHPDLEGDRDTRALCQRLHSIIFRRRSYRQAYDMQTHLSFPNVDHSAHHNARLLLSIAQSNSYWANNGG